MYNIDANMLRIIFAIIMALSLSIQAQTVNDPMRPPGQYSSLSQSNGQTVKPAFDLQSTIVSPTKRLAVIDGQRLRIGDVVGQAKIVSITPGIVRLRGSNGDTVLRLNTLSIKKPTSR